MKRLLVAALFVLAVPALAQEIGFTTRPTEVKAEPFSDAATVGTLAQKAQVKVTAKRSGWARVESSSVKGWVRMLALRMGNPATQGSGDSGVSSLFNVARSGSSGTTVATGVRGLDKEKIKNAQPNFAELDKLSAFKASKPGAEKFAAGKPALKAQSIEYLSAQADASR